MARLLKAEVIRRTDEIKLLLLANKPFKLPLGRLYEDLRLQSKHVWIIQTYRLLLLYANEKQAKTLLHPAVLQAFLLLGHTQQAQQIATMLSVKYPSDPETKKLIISLKSRQENILPAYTALSSFSNHIRPQSNKKSAGLTLPTKWKGLSLQLDTKKLQELNYAAKYKRLNRAPHPYRKILQDNFDELIMCYLLKLDRALIGLSGALLEMILIVHLYQKHQLKKITIKNQHKKIFDLSLAELLDIYHQKQLLPPNILQLCRAARTQRNFIHPGKEISEKSHLTSSGTQICFLAVMETIDALF